MTARAWAAGWCVAGCAWLAGCAAPPAASPAPVVQATAAQAAAKPGISTRAELLAALGPTRVAHFDSGYEVWVYRLAAQGEGASREGEFVVLIAPSGLVAKTRVRWPAAAEVEDRLDDG